MIKSHFVLQKLYPRNNKKGKTTFVRSASNNNMLMIIFIDILINLINTYETYSL